MDPWSGASRHADVDEQPRIHVPGSRQDRGGGGFRGRGAGEVQADPWSGASRHADIDGQPRIHGLESRQDRGGC